jgi:tetratricopeptide (TPR) repeat protein
MAALQMKKDGKDGKDGQFSQILKWVGYLTAIFSLCATVWGVGKYLYGRAETLKSLSDLFATETEQEKSRDYPSAWQTLEKAAKLDPDSAKVRAAQKRLAVTWLDAVYFLEDQKYSAVAQKLEPVLSRAAAAAKPGRERADLRARVGWAYFLESRDGTSDVDPIGPFREAVAEDVNNPYAEAMWGYSLLWNHCFLMNEAGAHFSAAISSQRDGEFVRRLQLYALLGCNMEEADQEVVRVADAMRKEHRTVDDLQRSDILGRYYFELAHQTPKSAAFINAVPPAEHVATFHWLFDVLDANSDGSSSNRLSRLYYLAQLQEAAGQHDDALANYKSVVSQTTANTNSFWDPSNAAVKRLSRSQ